MSLSMSKFKINDLVQVIKNNLVQGVISDINKVGQSYQVGITTDYGRFIYFEHELDFSRNQNKVLKETKKEPKKIKIDYLNWYNQLFRTSLEEINPEFNKGQISMKARSIVIKHFKEQLKDKTIEQLYLEQGLNIE